MSHLTRNNAQPHISMQSIAGTRKIQQSKNLEAKEGARRMLGQLDHSAHLEVTELGALDGFFDALDLKHLLNAENVFTLELVQLRLNVLDCVCRSRDDDVVEGIHTSVGDLDRLEQKASRSGQTERWVVSNEFWRPNRAIRWNIKRCRRARGGSQRHIGTHFVQGKERCLQGCELDQVLKQGCPLLGALLDLLATACKAVPAR